MAGPSWPQAAQHAPGGSKLAPNTSSMGPKDHRKQRKRQDPGSRRINRGSSHDRINRTTRGELSTEWRARITRGPFACLLSVVPKKRFNRPIRAQVCRTRHQKQTCGVQRREAHATVTRARGKVSASVSVQPLACLSLHCVAECVCVGRPLLRLITPWRFLAPFHAPSHACDVASVANFRGCCMHWGVFGQSGQPSQRTPYSERLVCRGRDHASLRSLPSRWHCCAASLPAGDLLAVLPPQTTHA